MNYNSELLTKEPVVPSDASRTRTPRIDKTIVVEFVGLPGAGKSTNCYHFVDKLRERGFTVAQFADVKNTLYQRSSLSRIKFVSAAVFSSATTIGRYILELLRSGIWSIDAIYRYCKLVIFNAALTDFVRQWRPDIILLDQWVIQGLWSATIFQRNDVTGLRLKRFYFNIDWLLYFKVDEYTAAERIIERPTDTSRFDHMDLFSRIDALRKYNGYLKRLYTDSECSNKLELSTKNAPRYNANLFADTLVEQLAKTGV